MEPDFHELVGAIIYSLLRGNVSFFSFLKICFDIQCISTGLLEEKETLETILWTSNDTGDLLLFQTRNVGLSICNIPSNTTEVVEKLTKKHESQNLSENRFLFVKCINYVNKLTIMYQFEIFKLSK